MLVEVHLIQNHAPANLNRDDTDSPKDCVFGGVRRSRISSQCLKRSIRRSPLFQEALGSTDLAMRTRRLPELVRDELRMRGLSWEMAVMGAFKVSGFGNKDGKEQNQRETSQMMFLTPSDVRAVADAVYQALIEAGSVDKFQEIKAADLQKKAVLKGWRPVTPDVALFGRMITSDAFRDVEAALQVAHALSTHKMVHEFDYFTAVDDLKHAVDQEAGRGAGMIGDVEFTSACYYKYFTVDVEGLVENLAGKPPEAQAPAEDWTAYDYALRQSRNMARHAIVGLLKAAVFTAPSGKQTSFAAHQLPDAILVEVRPVQIPVSYANAFVQPVTPKQRDLVEESLLQFTAHVTHLTRKFSLPSVARLWFTTRSVALDLDETIVCDTLDVLVDHLSAVLEGSPHG